MSRRLRLADAKALLLWAVITAAMFAALNLLIVHFNIEPPEAMVQMLISVTAFLVYGLIYCSVVALVIGSMLIVLTNTRMQTGLAAAAVHGAVLGLASVVVGMFLFFFSGSILSVLTILLLGATCGASAGVITGRTKV